MGHVGDERDGFDQLEEAAGHPRHPWTVAVSATRPCYNADSATFEGRLPVGQYLTRRRAPLAGLCALGRGQVWSEELIVESVDKPPFEAAGRPRSVDNQESIHLG